MAAQSNAVIFVNPNEPLHGHLALTNDTISEMRLMWITRDTKNPEVQWGNVSKQYTNKKSVSSAQSLLAWFQLNLPIIYHRL